MFSTRFLRGRDYLASLSFQAQNPDGTGERTSNSIDFQWLENEDLEV